MNNTNMFCRTQNKVLPAWRPNCYQCIYSTTYLIRPKCSHSSLKELIPVSHLKQLPVPTHNTSNAIAGSNQVPQSLEITPENSSYVANDFYNYRSQLDKTHFKKENLNGKVEKVFEEKGSLLKRSLDNRVRIDLPAPLPAPNPALPGPLPLFPHFLQRTRPQTSPPRTPVGTCAPLRKRPPVKTTP